MRERAVPQQLRLVLHHIVCHFSKSKLVYPSVDCGRSVICDRVAIGDRYLRRQAIEMKVVQVATVLLVHDAWLDGSSWAKILPDLKSNGYPIIAVQLPLTDLQEDVATVRRAMARESGPLLLVGHGYGGSVISAAGNTSQVKGLVFIAGFAPDASESAASLLTLVPKAPLAREMQSDSNGYIRLTAKGIHEDFAQDLTATEKMALVTSQAPTSVNALSGAIKDSAWRSIPSWYLVTENDRAVPPQLQFMMAAKVQAQTTSASTSHVAMLSRPDIVAEIIGDATKSVFQST